MHQPYETATAPVVYEQQPIALHPQHQVVLAAEAADPRRALVQLEDGQWVVARVPPAPPVIVPAAPQAVPRRPLSPAERASILVVSSTCALTLSAGGALAMAGPYLAQLAHLAFGTAALLGTGVAGWLGIRLTGAASRTATSQPATAPQPATPVVIHGQGGNGGRWASRGGAGVHITHLTINR